ncbi:MAG: FkbM family methyltransferase [Lachnospiraceae bacterium]|nr:FkbM family methyltransferase [Lachnospiraceae bacterium]
MEKVIVYGLGSFFEKHKEEVKDKFDVVQYFDKGRGKGEDIDGVEVCSDIHDLKTGNKVLIMVSDIDICRSILHDLYDAGIKKEDILLGISYWGDYSKVERITVDEEAGIHLCHSGINIVVSSKDEFVNSVDTLVYECYKHKLASGRKEIVFDVGMNVGDATVYFASNPNVEFVYGFEPFCPTYNSAVRNININKCGKKVKTFMFGLSGHNEMIDTQYDTKISCGLSTVRSANNTAMGNYKKMGMLSSETIACETVEIKKSSEVFEEIINRHSDVDYILKLDCEGEEFNIMEDLSSTGMIRAFSLIMMEWHYKSSDRLIELLDDNGFSYMSAKKQLEPELGLLYAWKQS